MDAEGVTHGNNNNNNDDYDDGNNNNDNNNNTNNEGVTHGYPALRGVSVTCSET